MPVGPVLGKLGEGVLGMTISGIRVRAALVLMAVTVALSGPAWAWTQAQNDAARVGRQEVAQKFGNLIPPGPLADYVTSVGERVVAATAYAHERWTFSVIDTPVVNAFATDGGVVYVTRGLLALANSEAELAAVIGHEVAHVTARHVTKRSEQGGNAGLGVLIGTALGGILGGKDGLRKGIELSTQVASGYVAQFSQKQEFEADELGIRTLAAAGYDPLAQARFLEAMIAHGQFEARIAGERYNPNRVDLFASHPATGDRVRRATLVANRLPPVQNARVGREHYLEAINGMMFGDSPEQGFVRGTTFTHPEMQFRFDVPQGFVISNGARSVTARAAHGATYVLDSGGRAQGSPSDYIIKGWVPNIAARNAIGEVSDLTEYRSNGLRAASAYLPVIIKGQRRVVQLTVIEHGGRFHRLAATTALNDPTTRQALANAAKTFRPIPPGEAAAIHPFRITVQRIGHGDTLARIARNMPVSQFGLDLLLTLNGVRDARELRNGDLIKVIAE